MPRLVLTSVPKAKEGQDQEGSSALSRSGTRFGPPCSERSLGVGPLLSACRRQPILFLISMPAAIACGCLPTVIIPSLRFECS